MRTAEVLHGTTEEYLHWATKVDTQIQEQLALLMPNDTICYKFNSSVCLIHILVIYIVVSYFTQNRLLQRNTSDLNGNTPLTVLRGCVNLQQTFPCSPAQNINPPFP